MSSSLSPTRKRTFPNTGARSTPIVPSQQQKVHITHNSTTAVNTTRTGLFAVTTPSSYAHCSQHMRRPMSLATPKSIPDKYGIAAIIPFGKIQEGGAGTQKALEMSRDSQWSRNIEKQRFCFNIAANEVFLGRQNNAHVRRIVEAKKKIDNSCPRGLTIMEEDGRRECTVGSKYMSALEIRRVNAYLRKLRNEHHAHRIVLEEEDRVIRGALKLEERGVAAEEHEVASWGPLYFRNKKQSAPVSALSSKSQKPSSQKRRHLSKSSNAAKGTKNTKLMMPCTPEQFERLMVDLRTDSDPRTTYRRYLEEREKSTARLAYASDPFREQLQHQHDRMLVEEGDEMLSIIDDVPFSYEVVRFEDTTYIVYNNGADDDVEGDKDDDDEGGCCGDQHHESGNDSSNNHGSNVHKSVTFAASYNSQNPSPLPHHHNLTRPTSALVHRPQQSQPSTMPSTRPGSAGSTGRITQPTSIAAPGVLTTNGYSPLAVDPPQHYRPHYQHPQRQRLAPSDGYAAADIFRLERQLERVEAGEPAKVAPVKSVFDCLYDDAKRQHSTLNDSSKLATSPNFLAVAFGSSCSRSTHTDSSRSAPGRSANNSTRVTSPSYTYQRKKTKNRNHGIVSPPKYRGGGGCTSSTVAKSSTDDTADVCSNLDHPVHPHPNATKTSPTPFGKEYDQFTVKVAELDADEAPVAADPTRVQMDRSWGQRLQVFGLSPTSTYSAPITIPRPTSANVRSPLNNRTQPHQHQPSPSSSLSTTSSPVTAVGSTKKKSEVIRHSASYSLSHDNSINSPSTRTLSPDSASPTKESYSCKRTKPMQSLNPSELMKQVNKDEARSGGGGFVAALLRQSRHSHNDRCTPTPQPFSPHPSISSIPVEVIMSGERQQQPSASACGSPLTVPTSILKPIPQNGGVINDNDMDFTSPNATKIRSSLFREDDSLDFGFVSQKTVSEVGANADDGNLQHQGENPLTISSSGDNEDVKRVYSCPGEGRLSHRNGDSYATNGGDDNSTAVPSLHCSSIHSSRPSAVL